MITLKKINEFLKEKQPSLKMQLATILKNNDSILFSNIMQQKTIILNNKKYCYSINKKQYILAN